MLIRVDGKPMHTHDTIAFVVGLGKLCPHEVHSIEHHGARKNHDVAGLIGDSQIVTQVAPGKVGYSEFIVLLREVQVHVWSEFPLSGGVVTGEDCKVDAEAIRGHVCYASILRPCYFSERVLDGTGWKEGSGIARVMINCAMDGGLGTSTHEQQPLEPSSSSLFARPLTGEVGEMFMVGRDTGSESPKRSSTSMLLYGCSSMAKDGA